MRHLGMHAGELAGKPYAKYWNPRIAPLVEHARDALARGPVAQPLLPGVERAAELLEGGEWELENGFTLCRDGALHVAIRTDMPDTSPAMIDWWFAWHGNEAQRYKLWHPQAHVQAAWADGRGETGAYVGRTSHVEEYLGSKADRFAIRFVSPATLGLNDLSGETAVCARVGFAEYPVDAGYLIHHVRPVPGGAEMRSRFYLGGHYAGTRDGSVVGAIAVQLAKRIMRPTVQDGMNLLVHCSEEMSHLATFLPRLYRDLSGVSEAA